MREREARERRRAARDEDPAPGSPEGAFPDTGPVQQDSSVAATPPPPITTEMPLAPQAGEDEQGPLPLPEPEPSESMRPRAQPARVPPPRRRGRSLPARAGAVLALALVIVVGFLIVRSLHGSGHATTALPPPVVKLVIPEGKTRLQIAQMAAAAGLRGSYRAHSRRSPLLDPARYGAPAGTDVLEGFLFPATYDMNAGDNVSKLVREQLLAFREQFGSGDFRRAHDLHVTPYQLLTVASMVEREALTAHDRPLIAAVIYNRLRQHIPLGIDATIYYAVELQRGIPTYTHELTTAQLHIESPYNTRTHTGLPPTPISNPGIASIEAAAHPAHVPFLYYVAAADGCGEQVFSTTFSQFERNAAAYKAAVSKNGGHPPVCKSK